MISRKPSCRWASPPMSTTSRAHRRELDHAQRLLGAELEGRAATWIRSADRADRSRSVSSQTTYAGKYSPGTIETAQRRSHRELAAGSCSRAPFDARGIVKGVTCARARGPLRRSPSFSLRVTPRRLAIEGDGLTSLARPSEAARLGYGPERNPHAHLGACPCYDGFHSAPALPPARIAARRPRPSASPAHRRATGSRAGCSRRRRAA